MKRLPNSKIFAVAAAIVLGGALTASSLAQAPAQPQQKPPADQQKPKQPAEANPFPEDTHNVPVLPNADTAAAPPPAAESALPPPVLPGDDADPVRSPDDPLPNTLDSGGSSSSNSPSLAKIIAPPPDESTRRGRNGKAGAPPEHTETAKDDENVGGYYLNSHDWKGALSRFESALVLDPENPDVYWGLAEAQRHLGQFAAAKANYAKVMEYDPDSKHAKDAKKILNDPEMAAK